MSFTEEELEARRAYLGGTDAAALAGLNPPGWAQPIDVYLEKVGQSTPRRQSRTMALGQAMEALVASLFTEATGVKLRRPAGTVRSRTYPWAGGNIDRWADDGAIYEGKWSMRRDEWGPSLPIGTVEAPTIIPGPSAEPPRMPPRYVVQVQHYLAVTGRELAYVGVLLGYADFRWYVLHRNPELISGLMELEERFWTENVLAGVPPEPDGSEAYGRHLSRSLHAEEGLEAVATPEQAAMVAELRQARLAREAAAQVEAAAQQRVQLSMGATSKLVGDGFTISYAESKPGLTVKWEELATALLRDTLELQGRLDAWPKTKKGQAEVVRSIARGLGLASVAEQGSRPFRPTWTSDDEE